MQVINFSTSDRTELIERLIEACTGAGLFVAMGFDRAVELAQSVQPATLGFFRQGLDAKLRWRGAKAQQGFAVRGPDRYVADGEILQDAKQIFDIPALPDVCETSNSTQLPTAESSFYCFHPALTVLITEWRSVELRVLGAMSLALSKFARRTLAEDALATKIGPHRGLLRLNYYPAMSSKPESGLRDGAHTDWSSITLLWSEQPGLSVETETGWELAELVPGGLFVHVGELLELLTDGQFRAGRHRVEALGEKERLSIAYFGAEIANPMDNRLVSPIFHANKSNAAQTFSLRDQIQWRVSQLH